jgi:hypothetical protein
MTIFAPQAKTPAATVSQASAPVTAASTQPIKVVVEKLPDDRHDYAADFAAASIGLIGALVGAYVGAKVTAAIARKQKSDEERERDDIALVSLFRIINKSYTFATGYVNDANLAVDLHNNGKAQFASAALQGYANYPSRVNISGDELYRSKRVGGYEFSNMIIDLDDRFNSLLEMLTMYRALRTQAMSLLKVESNEGTAVVGSVDKDQEALIKAEFSSLDSIISQSLAIADEIRVDSYHAMIKCVESIVEYFHRDQKIEMPDLDGKPQVIELKATFRK